MSERCSAGGGKQTATELHAALQNPEATRETIKEIKHAVARDRGMDARDVVATVTGEVSVPKNRTCSEGTI